jgi:hypothetical protein
MEGCCIVVTILFSRKVKFSYFRRKSIFAKGEIFAFSWPIFAKNEMIFVCIRENLFCPNPSYGSSNNSSSSSINSNCKSISQASSNSSQKSIVAARAAILPAAGSASTETLPAVEPCQQGHLS